MFTKTLVFVSMVVIMVRSDGECDSVIENILTMIMYPSEQDTMQTKALRRDLYKKLEQALSDDDDYYNEESNYLKRTLGSLARTNNMPHNGWSKRNLEALARGGHIRTIQEEEEEELKRSIANLAKNGQLPVRNAEKRGIESLARNGELRKLPIITRRDVSEQERSTKKSRSKRQADRYNEPSDEYPSPVYQNQNIYDYEEFMKALLGNYPVTEKRFLGSVAKSGWFRPSTSSSRFVNVDKRHIGSLARLGWLPTYRTVRRFNRSGRSISEECSAYNNRKIAANGEAEDDSIAENALPLDDNRFLLQPSIDKILLQKLYMRNNNKSK